MEANESKENIRLERWRLILGKDSDPEGQTSMSQKGRSLETVLEFLYSRRSSSGKSPSAPKVNDWLTRIRDLFDAPRVRELQTEAINRLGLEKLILEKEFLKNAEPNVELLATIVSLSQLMDDEVKATARQIVRELVREIEARLRLPLLNSVKRGTRRTVFTSRNKPADVHWHQTIMANLKNYQPAERFIIPEKWKGYRRQLPALKHIVLVIDQSASMSASVIYSAIFGSILSSVRSVSTRTYLFDTDVVDATEQLHDIVDLLFSVQLGGGTDISNALGVVANKMTKARDTLLFLISDLEDTGNEDATRALFRHLISEGVQCYNLVSLSDQGRPNFNRKLAEDLKHIGVPYMYCSPADFPEILEEALGQNNVY